MLSTLNYGVEILDKEVKKVLHDIKSSKENFLEEEGCSTENVEKAIDYACKVEDGVFWAYYHVLPFEKDTIKVFSLEYYIAGTDLVVQVKIETDSYEESITKKYKNTFPGGTI